MTQYYRKENSEMTEWEFIMALDNQIIIKWWKLLYEKLCSKEMGVSENDFKRAL